MVAIELVNQSLFLQLNASADPPASTVMIAKLCADTLIFLVPLTLVCGWLRATSIRRRLLLEAAVAGLLALGLNQLIGLVWSHPRPFMIGLGHTLIPHVADSSFPSDHVTLLSAVAVTFLIRRRWLKAGLGLALLVLPVAWARIYLGVHFPLDMLGAILVAGTAASIAFLSGEWYLNKLLVLALTAYRWLFAPLIRRGWLLA